MEIKELYKVFIEHPIVTTDSRTCPKDSIFFALKGDSFNGNHFAESALEQGCSYVIVDEWEDKPANNRIIVVDDVLKTLQDLAHFHRRKLKTTIIGITGTNGKTTTKELVATVLMKSFNVLYTKGNFNNHIGVPLTLLSMSKEHEVAVVEMGANHLNEIARLCEIVEPNIGLITNIGTAHIEGFGSFENVKKAKGELYDYIRSRDGKVFVNNDDQLLVEMSDGINRTLYGRNNPELFTSGNLVSENPFLEFDWYFFDRNYRIATRLVGSYNLENAFAAIAIGKYFGVSAMLISEALEQYRPTNNRSQFMRTPFNDLIIDAYNANPTSMKVALDFFAKTTSPMPKSLILGDMKELGEVSEKEHLDLVNQIKEQDYENVYLVGSVFKNVIKEYPDNIKLFDNVNDLIEFLKKNKPTENYILLKGSHSNHLEKSIEFL